MIYVGPKLRYAAISCFVISVIFCSSTRGQAQEAQPNWQNDWELAENLSMEIDTAGYTLPSHIVFVPQPGLGPMDPLYFVLELKGSIKVVTNNRSVLTFAENILPIPQGPDNFDPVGLTGLCLDTVTGFVFVTFAYLDREQTFRNGMARFSTSPKIFGVQGHNPHYLLDLFNEERSATSHQIGPCQIKDGNVYVAVGFGDEKTQSQNLHSTLGSIIRMDLDFNPVETNPFFAHDGYTTAIDYIWAYGFRNVFGLRFVDERLFATENGGDVDRFNEIEEGTNYLWDGSDWGIGAHAVQTFSPAVGIVHLDFIPKDNLLFPPAFQNKFVAAASGIPGEIGRSPVGSRSLLMLDFNFKTSRMRSVPRPILNYRGEGMQLPVSVALGPDGLYFVSLLPNSEGVQGVYRITYNPDAPYPHRIGQDETPMALINKYNCRQCHIIAGAGGRFAPALDGTLSIRLNQRLSEPDYVTKIKKLDAIDGEPYASYRDERSAIIAATGESRTRLWLQSYLQNPSFDNPEAQMPQLGVSRQHAEIIGNYLLTLQALDRQAVFSTWDKLRFFIAGQIPELRYRHLIFALFLGGLMASIALISATIITKQRK